MSRKGGPAEDDAHAFTPDTLNVKYEIDKLVDACDTNDASVFDTFFARVRATILIFNDLDIEVRHMTEEDQATFNDCLVDIADYKDIILTYKSPPEQTEAERIKFIQRCKTHIQTWEDRKKELAEKTKENFKKQLFECYKYAVISNSNTDYDLYPGSFYLRHYYYPERHLFHGRFRPFHKKDFDYAIIKAAKAASPFESQGRLTVLEAILLEKEKDDILGPFFEETPVDIISEKFALAIVDAAIETAKYDNVNMLLQYLKVHESKFKWDISNVYDHIFYKHVVDDEGNYQYDCLRILLRHKRDYSPERPGLATKFGRLFNVVRQVVATNSRGMHLVSAMGIELPRRHFDSEANSSKKRKLAPPTPAAECAFVDLSLRL